MPAEHVQETLRRTFIYKFMRPDDIASAPIDFPGIKYKDGRLANGMKAEAAAHLIEALRGQGSEIVFQDPAADVLQAMQHILWDRWTPAEVGEHEYIGQLFDDHGRIYHGCPFSMRTWHAARPIVRDRLACWVCVRSQGQPGARRP